MFIWGWFFAQLRSICCPLEIDLFPSGICLIPNLLPTTPNFPSFFVPKIILRTGKPNDVYLKGPSFQNMYLTNFSGQQAFCGLTKRGKKEYKRLLALCNSARANPLTHKFEKTFLKDYQGRNGIIATSAEENKKAKRRKKNDEAAEESEEEEEGSGEGEPSLDNSEEESSSSDVEDDDEGDDDDDEEGVESEEEE